LSEIEESIRYQDSWRKASFFHPTYAIKLILTSFLIAGKIMSILILELSNFINYIIIIIKRRATFSDTRNYLFFLHPEIFTLYHSALFNIDIMSPSRNKKKKDANCSSAINGQSELKVRSFYARWLTEIPQWHIRTWWWRRAPYRVDRNQREFYRSSRFYSDHPSSARKQAESKIGVWCHVFLPTVPDNSYSLVKVEEQKMSAYTTN